MMKPSRKQLLGILVFQMAFLGSVITAAQVLNTSVPEPPTFAALADECVEADQPGEQASARLDLSRLHFSLKRLWK